MFAVFVGRALLTTLSFFSRLHADIITSFKLINIPEAAYKNPFKCDYGIGQQRCYTVQRCYTGTMFTRPFSSRPNVKEEKVWLRETSLVLNTLKQRFHLFNCSLNCISKGKLLTGRLVIVLQMHQIFSCK